MQATPEQQLWMYEKMVVSRRLEEAITGIYMEGKSPVFNMADGPIPGEMHLFKQTRTLRRWRLCAFDSGRYRHCNPPPTSPGYCQRCGFQAHGG